MSIESAGKQLVYHGKRPVSIHPEKINDVPPSGDKKDSEYILANHIQTQTSVFGTYQKLLIVKGEGGKRREPTEKTGQHHRLYLLWCQRHPCSACVDGMAVQNGNGDSETQTSDHVYRESRQRQVGR